MSSRQPEYLSPATVPESREILSREDYGDLVVDVGAGNLAFTDHLEGDTDEGTTVLATDLPGNLESYIDAENVIYAEGNGAEFVQPGSADTVYAINVIQESEDPAAFLEGLESARAQDGEIVISFPDSNNSRAWPEKSLEYDEKTGFRQLSVPQKDEPDNYEQLFVDSEWVEDQAESMGIDVIEDGRVALNPAAIESIAERAQDPTFLPDPDSDLPDDREPSVKYYVLGNK